MLIASVLLSSGCAPRTTVIPDPTVVHEVAEEGELVIWTRMPDGRMAKVSARVLPGFWIAGPPVVEPMEQR